MIPTQQIYSSISAKSEITKSSTAKSISNFDFTSLTLLHPEVKNILTAAERSLSEFHYDSTQSPLVVDSALKLQQLADVFNFISFDIGSHLAHALSKALVQLSENKDTQNQAQLLSSLVQGVLSLSQYIEFVLNQQTLEPRLLLPILNEIRDLLGDKPLTENDLRVQDSHYITLANPAANFQAVDNLKLDSDLLTTAYRAGLAVMLTSDQNSSLSSDDIAKIEAMHAACATLANESKSLFWQAAAIITQYRDDLLPLNQQQKNLYIFIEQQFRSYLPADDRRFAELVSFACQQPQQTSSELHQLIKNQLLNNKLSESSLLEFKRIMQGPDQHLTVTLKHLIQQEINSIKAEVDTWANYSMTPTETTEDKAKLNQDFKAIADKLLTLASTLQILNLNKATETLQQTAKTISSWSSAKAVDFELFLSTLLSALITAENAVIALTKEHTPNEDLNSVNNDKISTSQLDSANIALIKQSRNMISSIEHSISNYIDTLAKFDYSAREEATTDVNTQSEVSDQSETAALDQYSTQSTALSNLPNELKQLAGVLKFIGLTNAANTVNQLALSVEVTSVIEKDSQAEPSEGSYFELSKMADILLAIDYQLYSKLQGQPIDKHAMYIANRSLSELRAA